MTLVEGIAPDETTAATLPTHPLEPLAPEELSAAAAVLGADERFPEGTRFVFLELAESTGALPVGEDPVFGTTIAPGLMAPNHERYSSVRLDMQVDGRATTSWRSTRCPSRPVRPIRTATPGAPGART